jgi:ribonucrease Y
MGPEIVVAALVSAGVGYFASQNLAKKKIGASKDSAEKELKKAKNQAEELVNKAKTEALEVAEKAQADENKRRDEFKHIETRLVSREETLDRKLDELDKRNEALRKGEHEVEALKNEIRDIRGKQQEKLEKIAKLTREDAASKLMQMTERDIKNDMLGLISKLQNLLALWSAWPQRLQRSVQLLLLS